MSRNLSLFAACALAVVFCLPVRGQDSPSLGDLARQAQAQKDKTNKPPAKVFTNDDLFPGSGPVSSAPVAAPERVAQPAAPAKSIAAAAPGKPTEAATPAKPIEAVAPRKPTPAVAPGKPEEAASPSSFSSVPAADQLQRMQSVLDQLDTLDRATLAKSVLQGVDNDFPGRSQWEEKLFTTKQDFVAQGRGLMKKAQQLEASARNVPDIQNPNDPRAQNLSNQLQQLVQEGAGISKAFQAVAMEGRDLAGQSAPH